MQIKAIKTEQDYEKALAEIEKLFNAKPDTPRGDKLEILTILVEAYEQAHYPILPPDPVEAIKFRMEQLGLMQKDLASIMGGMNRVSEVLNRKRKLSINMIKKLHKQLGIPAESLIAEQY